MANAHKVLGQIAPAITTNTTLYTVPGATQTIASTFYVANRGAAATFRMAVRVGGAALSNKDYIYYDIPIQAGDSFAATVGLSLSATDVVTVYASTADLSFSLFGVEIT